MDQIPPKSPVISQVTAPPFLFPQAKFLKNLRPSQVDAVEIAIRELQAGKKRLHIVAPPGSGKTVLGLYLWAACVRRPALVLSPNSAIQAQWAERVDLFQFAADAQPLVSLDGASPGLLTSLTYQSVTMPARGGEDADAAAKELWKAKLIEKQQAQDPAEADVWIDDLRRHNPDYYEDRLSLYRKQFRDAQAQGGKALEWLHSASLAILNKLREKQIGLIIFDECHHLLGHWGRVLADAHELLDHPVIVGLTATPPDIRGKSPEDVQRYEEFFGPIHYEIPVPAVVKDGYLAPYQDLVYFVRPTSEELSFLANADEQLHQVVDELCQQREIPLEATPVLSSTNEVDNAVPSETPTTAIDTDVNPLRAEPLLEWLEKVLHQRQLPTGKVKDWASFERRDSQFANCARWYLQLHGRELPKDVPPPPPPEWEDDEMPELAVLTPVLDRYIRHCLRRSPHREDQALAERVVQRLRMLGWQITETGSQACASPVGRVMAYARGKTQALQPILHAERLALGDKIRAVVVADFEKTSAITADVSHLLNAEAGGAMAAFRALLHDAGCNELDPVLVTGSSLLIDDDLYPRFTQRAATWLKEEGYQVELIYGEEDGFHVVSGRGADWSPRVYVTMITELFQEGLTKCLVGTRGLLGEGWDAHKVNVLIDLTTVTTSMSVNQLRGRSIRLDPDDAEKLSDNWDVVCIAPEFTKGLDDYERFCKKHQSLYGVADDGAVEKGVGHVHAGLTELKPEVLESSVQMLNAEMLARVARRAEFRGLWRIGEPCHMQPVHTVEVRPTGVGGFPPFAGSRQAWNEHSLTAAIGEAILRSLMESGQIPHSALLKTGQRAGGYVRVFLEQADNEQMALFATCVQETLGQLERPRYFVERSVDHLTDTWISRLLPGVVRNYFQKRDRSCVMLHPVPTSLAKNKELAAVFGRHWNECVSPGEVLYALQADNEKRYQQYQRQGKTPRGKIHKKEVFL